MREGMTCLQPVLQLVLQALGVEATLSQLIAELVDL